MTTILFVDDHHAFRRVIAEVLRNAGYKVLEAATPADLDNVLERDPGPIHVLIVEAVLTTTNGSHIATRLQERYPNLPVIFISDYPPGELRHRGLLPEGAPFIGKHAGAEELTRKVEELVSANARA
jgi:two-component system cell cycle sensor histidine kinase/response regulator CckA